MNKTISKISLSIAIAIGLVGCNKTQPIKQTHQIKKQKSNKPAWILNPNINNENAVVAVVSLYDKKTHKLRSDKKLLFIAKLKARAAFEAKQNIKVESTSTTKMNSNGNMNYNENIKLSSNSIQKKELIIKQTYKDKQNFYLWMAEKK